MRANIHPPMYDNFNPPQINGSACLMKNKIMLTGFNIDGLYNYNSKLNTYNKILDIQKELSKYIFKDWILTSEGKLYENSGRSLFSFNFYLNEIRVNFPLSTSYCAFKGFIYFMDMRLQLIRINTTLKKLEIISYAQSGKNTSISVEFQPFLQQENNPHKSLVINKRPYY